MNKSDAASAELSRVVFPSGWAFLTNPALPLLNWKISRDAGWGVSVCVGGGWCGRWLGDFHVKLSNVWNEPATNSSAHQLVALAGPFPPRPASSGFFFGGWQPKNCGVIPLFSPLSLSSPFQNGVLFFLPARSTHAALLPQFKVASGGYCELAAEQLSALVVVVAATVFCCCFSSISPPLVFPSFPFSPSLPHELHELRFQHAQRCHCRLIDMPRCSFASNLAVQRPVYQRVRPWESRLSSASRYKAVVAPHLPFFFLPLTSQSSSSSSMFHV